MSCSEKSLSRPPSIAGIGDPLSGLARRVKDVREWERFTGRARRKSKIEWKELITEDVTGPERISSGIARVAPGKAHGSHNHPHAIEIYYVLRGRANIQLGDEELKAEEGTEIFIPQGMKHGVVNDGSEDFTFFWLIGGKSSLSDYE